MEPATGARSSTPQRASHPQPYGATIASENPISSHYELQNDPDPQIPSSYERFNDEADEDDNNEDDDDDEPNEMSLDELLYSSSSYHAIVKPGKKASEL